MKTGYRIFLQALVLSFLGHAMFFSLFIVQDTEFEKKGQLLPMTVLQMRPRSSGRVEAATSSNPELIDPKLVQLAAKANRTTSPKLESHREAIVWEEEMASITLESDVLSWLVWSFRRDMPQYGDLFENPAMFPSSFLSQDNTSDAGTGKESDAARTSEISTSFTTRKLLQSSLPELPADMINRYAAPVKLRIGINCAGSVRFALPESGSANMLATIAANEVRKWRFSPVESFEDGESAENIEWGWITVPFKKTAPPDIMDKSGGAVNTRARMT
jgi:hypothetical protein